MVILIRLIIGEFRILDVTQIIYTIKALKNKVKPCKALKKKT